jgi:hypothetical protein
MLNRELEGFLPFSLIGILEGFKDVSITGDGRGEFSGGDTVLEEVCCMIINWFCCTVINWVNLSIRIVVSEGSPELVVMVERKAGIGFFLQKSNLATEHQRCRIE